MSKSLYERSLEALIEKLEARVAELESENARLVAEAAPKSLPFTSEPHESSPPPPSTTKRLNDDEKRAVLTAEGWTEHRDIADQNINVCWERGARWYSLEDAYNLVLQDREANQLLAAGWQPVMGLDDRERWSAPGGDDEPIPREYAIARLGAITSP